MRTDHEIFNTPIAVELTVVEKTTPANYLNYPEGKELGKTMPMWQVQTKTYHQGQPVGLVSSFNGFLDSPDTEWISGGHNSKSPMSVAIGRHGNFFHWGFAASPNYMTDEAKDTFTNALHYIAKFDGQPPLVRLIPGNLLRTRVDYDIQRYEAGKSTDEGMWYFSKEHVNRIREQPDKIIEYLRAVRPYLYPSGFRILTVDKEIQKIGVSNSDIAVLEKAVELLETNQNEIGKAILARYTTQSFSTKTQWADWLNTNRSSLFFTEAGGYKWRVNTLPTPEDIHSPPTKGKQQIKNSRDR